MKWWFLLVHILVCVGFARADWSVFEPIASVRPPAVDSTEWSDPIGAFVYDRLQENELDPPPSVDRRVWVRRAAYGLTGLPPEPSLVRALLEDPRPDDLAMAGIVDQLLASPRYGERWARHWLDVVRYADTDGFAIDEERLWLWRYRDYVVRQFNEDRPFDDFIREQIAGDELDIGDRGKIAVGYLRLGPWEADNMTAVNKRQDYLNDITTNVGSAFLGLTVGCARCHDHKFDPILQSDFYQLQAFFTPLKQAAIDAAFLPGEKSAGMRRRHDAAVARRQQQIRKLRATLRDKLAKARNVSSSDISDSDLDEAIKEKKEPITDADVTQLKTLQTDKKHLAPERRFESKVVSIRNPKQEEDFQATFLLNGGDPFDPGEKLAPGFLSEVQAWSTELVQSAQASDTLPRGRRTILANWLSDSNNPIPSRVLANRIWHYHFGTGIVATPNDFGVNGAEPSHPDLLDYLANQLLTNGWRLKPLHRQIVLSRAYRSAAHHPQEGAYRQRDPENRLLWRAPYRRLESEVVRDAVLAVSGRLLDEMGGPGFFEKLPQGMGVSYPFFQWLPSEDGQRRRRSIYMFQRRNLVHPMMEAFDGADPNMSCERRGRSVTAPQALSLFNGQFSYENSAILAKQLLAEHDDDAQRVDALFWRALSRPPSASEEASCVAFLDQKRDSYATSDEPAPAPGDERSPAVLALRDLSLAILNTNEFLYLD